MASADGVAFTFRQRAGRLDWKTISSIDLDEVIINLKINELQAVLDSVTFSEIVSQDIKHNTIDHVAKLIQVMQLIIEYLLNHQESQYSLITKLNHKINKLKESREKYYKENLVFREDVKTYQRQLHILRKAVNGGELNGDYIDAYHRLRHPPKVHGKYSDEDKRDDNKELVKTILDYERQSRNTMLSMLEDQRRTFSQEMLTLFESIKQQANNQSPPNNQLYMENIKLQIDNLLHNALDSYKENINKVTPLQKSVDKTPLKDTKVQDLLRESALETLEEELRAKSRELSKREDALKLREEALMRKERYADVLRQSKDDSSKSHNANVKDAVMKRKVGLQMMKTIFNNFRRRRINSMFRKWHGYTVEMRNREIYEEQGRMLLYANQKKTEYEEVLQRQLDEERQKQIHLQTKCNNMSLEMEILQDKIATYQQSRTQNQQMEMELASRLKEEQDKNVILNAKYNSLVSKSERERIEWMDKLHRVEVMSSSAPTKRETSIMTSMDFGSPVRKSSGGNKSMLLSLLPREFLSRDYDEDSLLHMAENRVTNKNSKETMEELVMKTLAKDFVHKLAEDTTVENLAQPPVSSSASVVSVDSTTIRNSRHHHGHHHHQHPHQPLQPSFVVKNTDADHSLQVPILR